MFFKNEEGIVAVLMALILPVMMIMIALVIDGGNLYIRHAELNFLAQQSANSGLLEFSKQLDVKATQNKISTCTVIPPASPPSVCSSDNIFNFLSHNEILAIFTDISVKNKVETNSTNFAKIYDPQMKIQNTNIQLFFGKNFSLGDDKIELQIILEEIPARFFSLILPSEAKLTVESISTLPLQ